MKIARLTIAACTLGMALPACGQKDVETPEDSATEESEETAEEWSEEASEEAAEFSDRAVADTDDDPDELDDHQSDIAEED